MGSPTETKEKEMQTQKEKDIALGVGIGAAVIFVVCLMIGLLDEYRLLDRLLDFLGIP